MLKTSSPIVTYINTRHHNLSTMQRQSYSMHQSWNITQRTKEIVQERSGAKAGRVKKREMNNDYINQTSNTSPVFMTSIGNTSSCKVPCNFHVLGFASSTSFLQQATTICHQPLQLWQCDIQKPMKHWNSIICRNFLEWQTLFWHYIWSPMWHSEWVSE